MAVYRVIDDSDEEVAVLDDDKFCFRSYRGEYCGGCENCLLMQASYYGYKIEKVENTNE